MENDTLTSMQWEPLCACHKYIKLQKHVDREGASPKQAWYTLTVFYDTSTWVENYIVVPKGSDTQTFQKSHMKKFVSKGHQK